MSYYIYQTKKKKSSKILVKSSLVVQGTKDLLLSLQQPRSLLCWWFVPWLRNFDMPRTAVCHEWGQKKRNTNKKIKTVKWKLAQFPAKAPIHNLICNYFCSFHFATQYFPTHLASPQTRDVNYSRGALESGPTL